MARTKKDINELNNVEEKKVLDKKIVSEKKVKKASNKVIKDNSDINNTYTKKENNLDNGLQIIEVLDTVKENASKVVKKAKNENYTYLFLKAFFKRLREDKLYLLAFIITVSFLAFVAIIKLQGTEGYYDRRDLTDTTSTDTSSKKENESQVKTDDIDVSSYVGVYTREISLSSSLKIDGACSIDSYKLVYQIKRDKTISKYLVDDCLGTVLIWSDNLSYVSVGGVRYISANDIYYLFATSSIKEVDGETFKLDESIMSLKEEYKLNDTAIQFYGSNFIIERQNDLILVKGSSIGFQLSSEYDTIHNVVNKTVYKTNDTGVYKFFVYSNDDSLQCYLDNNDDKELYKIYSIKYNEENGSFNKVKEVVSRSYKDGCTIYDQDIKELLN